MHEALTAGECEGETPVWTAAQMGELPVVQYLMEVFLLASGLVLYNFLHQVHDGL